MGSAINDADIMAQVRLRCDSSMVDMLGVFIDSVSVMSLSFSMFVFALSIAAIEVLLRSIVSEPKCSHKLSRQQNVLAIFVVHFLYTN